MADDSVRDELLDRRRAEVAALRSEVRRQRRPGHHRGASHRRLPLALAALLVAVAPLALLAASPFNDLTGCVPDVSYCPTANVTRQEMASFLARGCARTFCKSIAALTSGHHPLRSVVQRTGSKEETIS